MTESNRGTIKYVPEVTYGTTPVDSAAWKYLEFTGESLSATVNTTASAGIRSDRMLSDMPKTSIQVAGGVDFELSPVSFDDFLEAAMAGTWTTNVLEVGTTKRSFSIEKGFEDLGVYQSFKGMRVGQASLAVNYGSILTGSFQFMGNGSAQSGTSLVGTGSVADAATDVFNSSSDIGTVQINGSSTGICISSLSLDINNNMREITCIGLDAAQDISYGSSGITGTVEMYLSAETWALYGSVLSNADVSLTYTVSNGTKSYTFLLPKTKISGDSPQIGGKDQDVMHTFNFTALLDSVTGTACRITRV